MYPVSHIVDRAVGEVLLRMNVSRLGVIYTRGVETLFDDILMCAPIFFYPARSVKKETSSSLLGNNVELFMRTACGDGPRIQDGRSSTCVEAARDQTNLSGNEFGDIGNFFTFSCVAALVS